MGSGSRSCQERFPTTMCRGPQAALVRSNLQCGRLVMVSAGLQVKEEIGQKSARVTLDKLPLITPLRLPLKSSLTMPGLGSMLRRPLLLLLLLLLLVVVPGRPGGREGA